MLKGLEELFQENTVTTIKKMAQKYGFSEEEALAFMNVSEEVKIVKGKVKEVKEVKEKKVKEKKEKKAGPKIMLPFCGRVVEEWCEGVKLNHGLYNQCTSEKSASEKYCKSCKKQAETNESGKPTLGDINERMLKSSAEYRAEKGKKCVVYSVVMKKLKITKEDAVAEALKFGLEIPEEEFEMPKSQRGRPKKVSESESEKSGSDEGEKKRRGRPKKNKTVADNETDETDDLIASLVAEANALKSDSAGASAEENDAEENASEADASEADAEEESENSVLLQEIIAKINADETYNKMNSMVVSKNERKKHLNAIGDHIKTLLTEEELALYTGAPEEESEEEAEEVEDEVTRKAREAAEKKAQMEAEKLKKKEQADLEKKQQAKEKKEQADLEKKAKADLEKKAKAEADAEKKAQLEAEKKAKAEADAEKKAQLEAEKKAKAEADKKAKAEADAEKKVQLEAEKKAKKEQADLEKKAKKEQADLEKKAKAEADKKAQAKQKEEAAALKKGGEKKQAEVTPVEKKTTAELQVEPVEEAEASVADSSTIQTVNAKVFEFEGKKYLKTVDGILYDQETEDCVGVWNEDTKSIDDFADDEE